MVIPEGDSYTKNLNHRKIIRKTQKLQPIENQKNAETEYIS